MRTVHLVAACVISLVYEDRIKDYGVFFGLSTDLETRPMLSMSYCWIIPTSSTRYPPCLKVYPGAIFYD